MKTFAITTLGCKVNQYEGQQTRQLLEALGLRQAGPGETPDLVVVRTCCVTGTASSKSRRAIARAGRLSPAATIVATGCLADVQGDEARTFGPRTVLVGRDNDLPTTIEGLISGKPGTCQLQTEPIKPEKAGEINNKKGRQSDVPAGNSGFFGVAGAFAGAIWYVDGARAKLTD
jgi:threonylcarbamoyladenosine tRNA methylthiotransferase MtaB